MSTLHFDLRVILSWLTGCVRVSVEKATKAQLKTTASEMAAIKILFAILAAMIAGLIYFLIKPTHLDPIKPLGEKWWGEGERKEEGGDVVPFEIKFRQQKYTELLEKLENTRYFESLEDVDWKYGTRPDFMKSVVDHWINNFSWKDQVIFLSSALGAHFVLCPVGAKVHHCNINIRQWMWSFSFFIYSINSEIF